MAPSLGDSALRRYTTIIHARRVALEAKRLKAVAAIAVQANGHAPSHLPPPSYEDALQVTQTQNSTEESSRLSLGQSVNIHTIKQKYSDSKLYSAESRDTTAVQPSYSEVTETAAMLERPPLYEPQRRSVTQCAGSSAISEDICPQSPRPSQLKLLIKSSRESPVLFEDSSPDLNGSKTDRCPPSPRLASRQLSRENHGDSPAFTEGASRDCSTVHADKNIKADEIQIPQSPMPKSCTRSPKEAQADTSPMHGVLNETKLAATEVDPADCANNDDSGFDSDHDPTFPSFYPIFQHLCSMLGLIEKQRPGGDMHDPARFLLQFDKAQSELATILFKRMPSGLRRRFFLYKNEIREGRLPNLDFPSSRSPLHDGLERRMRKEQYRRRQRQLENTTTGPENLWKKRENCRSRRSPLSTLSWPEAADYNTRRSPGEVNDPGMKYLNGLNLQVGNDLTRSSQEAENKTSNQGLNKHSPLHRLENSEAESDEVRNNGTITRLSGALRCKEHLRSSVSKESDNLAPWMTKHWPTSERALQSKSQSVLNAASTHSFDFAEKQSLWCKTYDGWQGAKENIPPSIEDDDQETLYDPRKRQPIEKHSILSTHSARDPLRVEDFGGALKTQSGPTEQIFDLRNLPRHRPLLREGTEFQHGLALNRAIDVMISEICRLWYCYMSICLCIGVTTPIALPVNYDLDGLSDRLGIFANDWGLAKIISRFRTRLDAIWDKSWTTTAERARSVAEVGMLPYLGKSNLRRAVLEAALSDQGYEGRADHGMLGI